MIKKNIISFCLLAGLVVISCKKNETHTKSKAADSAGVFQSENTDSISQKPDAVKANPEIAQSENKSAEKDSTNTSFEGKYIAGNGCENGRYSIELKNVDGKPSFKIFDKTKVIASGNASIGDAGILMGEIGASIEGDKMVIQNTGNSMNPYQHFDCSEKYLEFNKQK